MTMNCKPRTVKQPVDACVKGTVPPAPHWPPSWVTLDDLSKVSFVHKRKQENCVNPVLWVLILDCSLLTHFIKTDEMNPVSAYK